jgi:hypothetical protein
VECSRQEEACDGTFRSSLPEADESPKWRQMFEVGEQRRPCCITLDKTKEIGFKKEKTYDSVSESFVIKLLPSPDPLV